MAARGDTATPASPLQWYGSLQSHARKIAAMLPPHDHYIEPFAGTAAVLLAQPKSKAKTEVLLRGVRIECLSYEDVLIDSPKTVAFLDPPYMPETRVELDVYPHEFTHKEHKRMLHIVCKLKKTKVILCGYRNGLYDEMLDGWRRTDFKIKSYAGPTIKGRKLPPRVLSVWTDYDPPS